MRLGLLRSAQWMFLDRFLRMGIGFGVGIVLARVYGPSGYGSISYVIALASVIGCVASLGLDELLPRDLAAGTHGLSRLDAEKTALRMRFAAECIAYFILLLGLCLLSVPDEIFWIAVVYGLYFPSQATDVIEFGRRVDGDYAGIARLRLGAAFLSASLRVTSAYLGLPLITIAFGMLAEFLCPTFFYLRRIFRNASWHGARWNPGYARTLLNRGCFIVLAGILGTLQARIDSLLIEQAFGSASLGQYAAALRIVELFDAFGIVLSLLLIPEFGRRKGAALERWARMAYLGGTCLFVLALPLGYLLWVFFPLIYGPAFAEAQDLMPWFFPRPYLFLLGSLRTALFLSEEKYHRIPLYGATSVTLTILLFAPLTEQYGLEGAAMAGTFSVLISGLALDLLFSRENLSRLFLSPLALPDLLAAFRRRLKSQRGKSGRIRAAEALDPEGRRRSG